MKHQNNQTSKNFEEVKLGDLFELKYGSSLPQEKRVAGKYDVYGSNGIVGQHNLASTKGETIIVGRKGSIGKINLSNKSCFPIDTTYYIDETKKPCNLKWLYFILKKLNLESLNRAAAVPGLNRKDVYLKRILLPKISEQDRIVKILEKAEKLKEKGEKTNDLFDEYLKSVFNEMFYNGGFEEVKLGDICEINPKKSEIEKEDNNLEVSFVPMTDISGHSIHFKPKEIRRIREVYTGYTYFREGDILLAKVTPCFENGKSGICKNLKNRIGFGSSEYHVLRPTKNILPELVYHIISSETFIKLGEKQLTGTAGLRRLPKYFVDNFKIPLPPIPIQQKFSDIAEQVEEMKENTKKTKGNSDELFNSLMQKAFRGEL